MPTHEEQKKRAREHAEHHMKHGAEHHPFSEHEYLRAKQNYKESLKENKETAVPKEMLEREYEHNPNGSYTHKRKGSYEE